MCFLVGSCTDKKRKIDKLNNNHNNSFNFIEIIKYETYEGRLQGKGKREILQLLKKIQ